jgi:hypothetical protein
MKTSEKEKKNEAAIPFMFVIPHFCGIQLKALTNFVLPELSNNRLSMIRVTHWERSR